jgi:hypothetical protein
MVEDLLKAYYTLFNVLRWNATAKSIMVSSFDVYLLFDSYLYSNIKSHQSNQTGSTALRNLISCQNSNNSLDILWLTIHVYL